MEHIRYDAVGEQVDAYKAQASHQREAQHKRIRAACKPRHEPDTEPCGAQQAEARGKSQDLVQPLSEEAEEYRHGQTADRLHGHDRPVADLVYAQIGHRNLGVGAEAVVVHAVECETCEAKKQQSQPAAAQQILHSSANSPKAPLSAG